MIAKTVPAARPGKDSSLDCWLHYIEIINPKPMELGLARMKEMISRMNISFQCPVFTVAGTNGKGSTCTFLESILRNEGYRVGMHTSPHLLRFNERCLICGREATDEELVASFEAVEEARGDLPLTYFEFTGLAILHLFQQADLSAVILEIGLGGRLDAMNAIDSACGILCAIGLDHTQYLGLTREAIGFEKACIYRPNVPAICADRNPPATVIDYAAKIGARLSVYGREFETTVHEYSFDFLMNDPQAGRASFKKLPLPGLAGDNQIQNAAGALAALWRMRHVLPLHIEGIKKGLARARITGRFERMHQADAQAPEIILDVGHNPQAAQVLAHNLHATAQNGVETWAVAGMLKDKDMTGVMRLVKPEVSRWFVASLTGPRAATAQMLKQHMLQAGIADDAMESFADVSTALKASIEEAKKRPFGTVKIIVFGSFLTVSAALEALRPIQALSVTP